VARQRSAYPQVEPGAAALVGAPVAEGSPRASAAGALDACCRAGVRALSLGPRGIVREEDLARVVSWGRPDVPARALAWTSLPVVEAGASEIDVRRHLLSGAPMVAVRRGRGIVGLIDRDSAGVPLPTSSVAADLERRQARDGDARLDLLRVAGKVADGMTTAAFAVGGFVRDLLLGRPAPDVDLVVEGDGIAFARRLADEIGGRVVTHAAFGTASIELAPAGAGPGRVDVATARRERYDRPGALPAVSPAGIGDDLARRDFALNAMAVALSPAAFGTLYDPHGGREDLRRRRLRPLHPLSFAEDPTRIFRAARYAARLGLELAPEAGAALRLALAIGDYPALSGRRLAAEIELLAGESRPELGLDLLLGWRALRLWHAGYRETPGTVRCVREAARLRARAHALGVEMPGADLALTALLVDQPAAVRRACLDRLAIRGDRRRALEAADGGVARRLGAPGLRPSAVVEALRPLPLAAIAGVWLRGPGRCRRRIEWYWREGRTLRPRLTGDDVMALGVAQGPAVGQCLARLRRLRADGVVRTAADERRFVKRWLHVPNRGATEALKGGVR
jgi:tRNA nucleotidyltransferase (CCA-adding enzyme)